MSAPSRNYFLDGPLPVIFARTALPIIFVMSMNGLLTVVDALFLGHFVGERALAAVTLIFPLFMLIVAFSTLVSGGMSSLVARHLGGGRTEAAETVFASAQWLALAASVCIMALYLMGGGPLILMAAGGDADLAAMSATYLSIVVFSTPLMFILSVQVDALRNEGHMMSMAAASLVISLSNIGFNYVLIAVMGMGVAGSAWGTVLAQALAFVLVASFRLWRRTVLHPAAMLRHVTAAAWPRILALGAPMSLNFIGAALSTTALFAALQLTEIANYATTVSAYGIITRITTFTFLPLMGLGQAMQTITGNNFGAGEWRRVGDSLRFALLAALVFCFGVEAVLVFGAPAIGSLFVSDPSVIAEVGRILPIMVTFFVISGPLMMIGTHFQAVGDAPRAAVLGLSKPYLFFIPLVFAVALTFGGQAIWWAGPGADLLLLGLTGLVLIHNARRQSLSWGLFGPPAARVTA